MKEALIEAEKAAEVGEIPVGAVIVYQGKIIARAHNRRELDCDALAHAEVLCIAQACKKLHSWRLSGCTLYVTLEPCPMCAGALAWSQIGRVVYGALDPKRGFSLYSPSLMHPKTEITAGVLAEECGEIVSEFFRNKRK